jgi:3-hydroxymyristoyl/3-hydroxydecanoyl-(acyl carrier protein) dehydratase
MRSERIVTVDAEHPALPGHFPGHHVVPGVVMLGEIMNAIREMADEELEFVGMPSVKFMSPLKPGESLRITLTNRGDGAMEFTCATATRSIASGCLQYRNVHGDPTGDS